MTARRSTRRRRALGLCALLLFPGAGLPGQERQEAAEARTLDPADEEALETWARIRLAELGEEEPGRPKADVEAERLWALYFLSVGEEKRVKEAQRLLDHLRQEETSVVPEGLLAGFQGALEVVRAKHAFWPPSKLKHLKSGIETLDREVARAPEDLRLRYLRLVSCFYLPFFLDQEDSVAEDMARLVEGLPEDAGAFPPFLARGVAAFLMENGELSPEDRARLQMVAG